MRKRPIELKFRLSRDECELLHSRLQEANMNRNAFLVRLISGAQVYPKDQLVLLNLEFQIMNRLLRGISTNVNQMAKIANASGAAPSAKRLVDMSQDIRVAQNNLNSLWSEVRKHLWQS